MPEPAPPRVLHVVESWRPVVSGYTSRSWHIVERQQRLGIARPRVLVTSRQGTYGATTTQAPAGVEVSAMPPSRRERWARPVRRFDLDPAALADAVAEMARDCDLVHVHWSSGIGRAAAQGARRAGRPLVAEVRFDLAGAMMTESLRGTGAWLERPLRRRFEAHVTDAAAVVAASHTLAALLERDCGVARARLSVVPNGVDPAPADAASAAGEIRARLGLNGATVIGTTSNMLRYENLGVILHAAAGLGRGHALFVGDGPVRGELERAARTATVPASFTGRVPPQQVPGHLAAMDVFAVPRKNATITRFASPLKVVEAMAMGRAIVATALGDVPTLLAEDRGVLVPADDAAAFAAAVHELARDPGRRAQLGERARAYAERELSWDSAVRRYASVYARVA